MNSYMTLVYIVICSKIKSHNFLDPRFSKTLVFIVKHRIKHNRTSITQTATFLFQSYPKVKFFVAIPAVKPQLKPWLKGFKEGIRLYKNDITPFFIQLNTL